MRDRKGAEGNKRLDEERSFGFEKGEFVEDEVRLLHRRNAEVKVVLFFAAVPPLAI